ncbi:hypothetical protein [Microcoleus sp. FACHB-831]|nr:hypothetical protein [Microcoleus sp. FACHB-831]
MPQAVAFHRITETIGDRASGYIQGKLSQDAIAYIFFGCDRATHLAFVR